MLNFNENRNELLRIGVSPNRLTFTKTLDMLLTTDYYPNDDALVLVPFEYDHFSKSWSQLTQGIPPTERAYSHVAGQNNNVQANGRPTGTFSDAWAIMECSGIVRGTNRTPGPPFVQVGSHWECVLALDGEADVVFKVVKN